MADPTTSPAAPTQADPALPPALAPTADTTPYVPVSWTAVAAALVVVLFLLILLGGGYDALQKKRPLLQEWILILPLAAVVLCFAARRVVVNSEGTRTGTLYGVDLITSSWWISLVVGLGYIAYLFAIDFAIRREATGEVDRWMAGILKGETGRAFYRTLEPGRRSGIRPDDEARLQAEFRDPYTTFRQSDLLRLIERNPGPGACKFQLGGLREWVYKPAGIECKVSGVLDCPEGRFPVQFSLKATEAGADAAAPGRQWHIASTPNGFVQSEGVTLTPYGWRIWEMDRQAFLFGDQYVKLNGLHPIVRLYAFLEFTRTRDDPFFAAMSAGGTAARLAAVGVPAGLPWYPGPEYFDYAAERLFRLPGGGKPSLDKLRQLDYAWKTDGQGLLPPGRRLRENPDKQTRVTVTDTAVEVRLPIEIPLPAAAGETNIYRGRVVVSCTDPELLSELKRLRESANPDQGSNKFPDPRLRQLVWKVAAVETDFVTITFRPMGPPGAPAVPVPTN